MLDSVRSAAGHQRQEPAMVRFGARSSNHLRNDDSKSEEGHVRAIKIFFKFYEGNGASGR